MSRHFSRAFSILYMDVITKILLKLPVKSLLRFTTTCKSWCSLIKSPKFIKSHIDESSSDINRCKILFISSQITLSSCLQYNTLGFTFLSTESSLSDNSLVSHLDPPLPIFSHDVSYPFVSSCNGLLCMVYSHTIILWNPAIGKYKRIPKPDYKGEAELYGFAYDAVTEDYKVVAISVVNAKLSRYAVGIYSVNNQSWRKIDNIPDGVRLFDQVPVSLDGTVNMMVSSSAFEKFAVISMCVEDEDFVVTPLPWENGRYMKLSNFANRLCLSMFVDMEFSVCYLEKLEGKNGWKWTNMVKVPLLNSLIENLDDIICLKENGNILWRKTDGGFLEYNLRKDEVAEFSLNEIPQTADLSTLYVESLASLKIPWEV